MARRRRKLAGPARRYRRSPDRYEAVRHSSPFSMKAIDSATKMGCRDAVKGRKNAHKPEAGGYIAAYREGYRICEKIYHTGKPLTRDESHVATKLSLESEIQFTPLGGARRSRRRR